MHGKIFLVFFGIALLLTSVLGFRIPATVGQVTNGSAMNDIYPGQSIQGAINSAQSGDTIFVHSGTYYESVVVNKTVALVGEHRETTIIDGNGIIVNVDNVAISGFTVQNGGGIAFSDGRNLTISQSILKNDETGISLYQVYDVIIKDNIVSSNGYVVGGITHGGSGIWIWNCFNVKIEDNSINDNLVEGIGTKLSGIVTITRNVISNNSVGIRLTSAYYDTKHEVTFNVISNHTSCGVLLDQCYSGHAEIEGNTVADNAKGMFLKWSSGHTITHNDFVNNTESASIYLPSVYSSEWDSGYPSGGNYWSDYNGTDVSRGFFQNETGSDGIGDISYEVDLSNTDHYPLAHPYGLVRNLDTNLTYLAIQSAIDANETLNGQRILVGRGVYHEHVFVGKELKLIGEDRDATVISGYGTETVVQLGINSSITNLTIRNGEYGAVYRSYHLTPSYSGTSIVNCRIMDNLYGGISMQGCANDTITDNIVSNNTLFGLHLEHVGNGTIANNTILNNGYGIDFYGSSNDNVLRNNNITGNKYNFGLIPRGHTVNFWSGLSPSKPGIVNDVDTSNTVDGKPIIYWVNRSDQQVPSDAGYVWLNNCTNITISNCTLSNNLQGIMLLYADNTSIVNNNLTDNAYGIYISAYCNNNSIGGNTLEDNVNGIYQWALSRFTTMRNNSISGGKMNFGFFPDMARRSRNGTDLINDIDASNTVDGKPIIYWIDQHDRQVPENAGYVMLMNSTNILVKNLNLSNNVQNIFVLSSNDTVIANNSVANSVYGIDASDYGWFDYNTSTYYRLYSFNTTVKGNIVADNGVGIRTYSDNSIVINNTLLRNPLGIYTMGASNSIISANLIVASDLNVTYLGPDLQIFYNPEWPWERSWELSTMVIGGLIVGGSNNLIHDNTVMDSSIGINMNDYLRNYYGSGNMIFHNNFVNNTLHQAIEARRGGNHWSYGYPSGGNYWSDYSSTDLYRGPDQNVTGSDGIGDTSYSLYPDNKDRYPLMNPWQRLPEEQVSIHAGDGIKYEYTVIGAPPELPVPEWLRIDFLAVEGTTATARVTMHMSDGTEQNQTMTFDVVGDGTPGAMLGLFVPANLTTGDSFYMSGNGYVTIAGETTRTYAGFVVTVVYANFSQYGTQLTYYWDKQTGIMVESLAISGSMTAIAKATETSIIPEFPTLVVLLLFNAATLLVARIHKTKFNRRSSQKS
jgi:parallel beta-helix repeat protein